ncbi:hypothetical protein BDP27DRAFT_1432937 [Rhodocollybia butyracea]|uniref:Uncharacterized protein n=2 Tax=Rhodocollybia butyracea TaxID=206335 RepID=A0A9P5PA20_9AGAR|nr:hypothetical protein BDP27DRAFT_1432937 [Rhodocollybia butyracea]
MGSTPFGPPTFVTEPAGFFLRPSQSLPPDKIPFRNSPVFSTPRKSMYRESVQLLKDSDDEGRLDSDGSNDEGKLDSDGSDDERKLNADSVGGLCDADTQTTVIDEGEKDMFNDERSKGEKENKGSQSHTSLLDKERITLVINVLFRIGTLCYWVIWLKLFGNVVLVTFQTRWHLMGSFLPTAYFAFYRTTREIPTNDARAAFAIIFVDATTAVGSFISMLLICSIVGAIVGSLSRILT